MVPVACKICATLRRADTPITSRLTAVEGDVVHGDRVAVRQGPRSCPRASRADGSCRRYPAQPFGGDHLLDGHLAVEELIAGQPHRAHAATTGILTAGGIARQPGTADLARGVVGNR